MWKAPPQVLVSSIDYNDYVGRIAIGRIERGQLRQNQEVAVVDYHNPDVSYKAKVVSMYQFEGLQRVPVAQATGGDIVAFSGIAGINIGNTVCDPAAVEAAAFCKDLRAHCGNGLFGQRQPLCRAGKANSSPPARSATGLMRELLRGCLPACGRDRQRR